MVHCSVFDLTPAYHSTIEKPWVYFAGLRLHRNRFVHLRLPAVEREREWLSVLLDLLESKWRTPLPTTEESDFILRHNPQDVAAVTTNKELLSEDEGPRVRVGDCFTYKRHPLKKKECYTGFSSIENQVSLVAIDSIDWCLSCT